MESSMNDQRGWETLEGVCQAAKRVFIGQVTSDSPEGVRILQGFIDRLVRIAERRISGPNAKLDSRDAAQEAIVAMWAVGWRRYGDRKRLSPVVLRILVNKCMDLNRRRMYGLGM